MGVNEETFVKEIDEGIPEALQSAVKPGHTHLGCLLHGRKVLDVYQDVTFSCDLEVHLGTAQLGTALCVGETLLGKGASPSSSLSEM